MRYFLILLGWGIMLWFSPLSAAESPLNFLQQGNPFDDAHGAGAWVSGDFGRARLTSCLSGVRDENFMTAGIQAQPNAGWRVVEIRPDSAAATATFPLIQMNSDESYHPILMPVADSQKPLAVAADVVFARAHQRQTASVSLTLPETHHYMTPYCAPLMAHLQYVPLPADKLDVSARVRAQEQGVQLLLTFPQDTRVLDMKWNDEPVRIWTQQKTSRQLLATVQPPAAGWEKTPLYVSTTRGIFDVRPTLSDAPLTMFQPVSVLRVMGGGLLLMVLSPYFLMILMSAADKKIKKKIRTSLCFLIPILGVGIGGFVATSRLFDAVQMTPHGWMVIALLWLGMLIYPRFMPVAALAAIVMLPKPYLSFIAAADTTMSGRLLIGLFWGLCLASPLLAAQKFIKPLMRRIQKIQKKTPYTWRLFASLPALLLLGWMIAAAMMRHIAYRAERPESPMIIAVDEPVCLSCVFPRLFYVSPRVAQTHVPLRSEEGKRLSAPFGCRAPFYIIRRGGREMILPAGAPRLEWMKALQD